MWPPAPRPQGGGHVVSCWLAACLPALWHAGRPAAAVPCRDQGGRRVGGRAGASHPGGRGRAPFPLPLGRTQARLAYRIRRFSPPADLLHAWRPLYLRELAGRGAAGCSARARWNTRPARPWPGLPCPLPTTGCRAAQLLGHDGLACSARMRKWKSGVFPGLGLQGQGVCITMFKGRVGWRQCGLPDGRPVANGRAGPCSIVV